MGLFSSLAAGVGSLVSGIFGGNDREEAAREASRQQVSGARRGIRSLQYGTKRGENALNLSNERIAELMQPFVQAGGESLAEMRNILGLGGTQAQEDAISSILSSPYFEELVNQSETALLQNQAVTGGLRGGDTQRYLATLRPQLAAQEIERRYNQLGGLTNLGYGATGQQARYQYGTGSSIADLYGRLGAGTADLENQIGAYQAGGTLGASAARQQRLYDIGAGLGGIGESLGNFFFPGTSNIQTPQRKPSIRSIGGRIF